MPASPVDTLRSWLFQKETAGCRVRVIDYNIHKLSCHSSKFQREKANYGLSVLRGFGEEVERPRPRRGVVGCDRDRLPFRGKGGCDRTRSFRHKHQGFMAERLGPHADLHHAIAAGLQHPTTGKNSRCIAEKNGTIRTYGGRRFAGYAVA
jgi:hypothetical protein